MIDPQDDPDLLESSKPYSTDPSDPWWQRPAVIWGAVIGAFVFIVVIAYL
jgi:hypothetical protein